MLEDTLQKLVDLAVEAAKPFVTTESSRHCRVLANGAVTFIDIPPKPRFQIALDLQTIVTRIINVFQNSDLPPEAHPTVWVSDSAVFALYNDADTREAITCPLVTTDVWNALQRVNGKVLTQREAVEFFYYDLGEYAGDTHDVIRSLNFTLQTDDARTLQRDRESLGASVTKTLSAATAVPKTVLVHVPVYTLANPRVTAPIKLFLTPDLDQRGLRIQAAPDAFHAAYLLTRAAFAQYLTDGLQAHEISVYQGCPWTADRTAGLQDKPRS